MTPEQFSSAWGLGLVRTEPAALLGVNIPEASRRFLIEAGLPSESECMCFGDAEEELPEAYRDLWPIGVDGATLICVQEETGHVYSIDVDGLGLPTRFVNSGVPELAQCLLIYRVVPGAEAADEEKDADEVAVEFTEHLAAAMRRVDPKAMQNWNNYWPGVLRAGLI